MKYIYKTLKYSFAWLMFYALTSAGPLAADFHLTNTNASPATVALFDYLASVYGHGCIGAYWVDTGWKTIHGVGRNGGQHSLSGKYGALQDYELSGFGAAPWSTNRDILTTADMQTIVNHYPTVRPIIAFQWHWWFERQSAWRNQRTPVNLTNVVTAGTRENTDFYADLAVVAADFQVFQNHNIPILFRPLHELDGGWFWWSHDGPNYSVLDGSATTAVMWRMIHDYLTRQLVNGVKDSSLPVLNNIIWVWGSGRDGKFPSYYPGSNYVDIVGSSEYGHNFSDDRDFFRGLWTNLTALDPTKMLALTECGSIPNPALMQSGVTPKWLYALTWHGIGNQHAENTISNDICFWQHPFLITEEKLPAFNLTGTANLLPEVGILLPWPDGPARFVGSYPVINGYAADRDGAISKIELYAVGTNGTGQLMTKVATLTRPPSNSFTFTWTNAAPGNYAVSAVAYDNGTPTLTATSQTVRVSYQVADPAAPAPVVAGGLPVASGRMAATSNPNGLNVMIIGHSLVGNLNSLPYLAADDGHPGHKQGHYSIPGAGIAAHFQAGPRPGQTNTWKQLYFPDDQKWDALVLSARDPGTDEEYAPRFAAEAFRNNPQCQIFIYGNWPDLVESFEKPEFRHTETHIENVAAVVDQAFPHAPKTRVMPCSLLIRELGRMADHGQLPGVASRFALFTDYGHPSRFAAYALDIMAMSMLYNEPPWKYPAKLCSKDAKDDQHPTDSWFKKYEVQVPEDTAAVMKDVVWDILQTYPPAGMPPRLVIANRSLDPVIAHQPFKTELKALNAAAPCTWLLANGSLPAGLTFSPAGVLSGTTAAVGDYPVLIKVTDGQDSAARTLVLSVSRDTPLVIPDQPVQTARLDEYVVCPLKVAGGFGALSWSVAAGKLPYGIRLTPAGFLVGSPGEAGQFDFTVKAEDSFPGGSRSVAKELKWTIGPAAPDTLSVRSLALSGRPDDQTLVIDGKLDEPFWQLDQKIARVASGTPTKTASFDAVWTYQVSNQRIQPLHLVLAFKVLDGAKGKTARDGIHIFINGTHNHAVIYSGDDTHFFISRSQPVVQSLRGKINWFCTAKVQEIAGGYTMEVDLWGNDYFSGEGNWLPFGEKGVYGLDVAVDEGDAGAVSQQVWRGDASDADDTSHFGTIVLTGQPAVTPLPR